MAYDLTSNDVYSRMSMLAFGISAVVTHDLCGNAMNQTSANYKPIEIPPCDWFWDSDCENNKTMPFYRTEAGYNSAKFSFF